MTFPRLLLLTLFCCFVFTVQAQQDSIVLDTSLASLPTVTPLPAASKISNYPFRYQTLTSENFNAGNIFDSRELLTGRVNGLLISKPGHNVNGRATARLRGVSSLYAGEGPLMVVDGFAGVDPRFLDPQDIEEVRVIPGGQGAAYYGLQGGGGVIHFATRSLFNSYEPGLRYHGNVGVSTVVNAPEVLDAAGHQDALRSVAELYGSNPDQLINRVNYGGDKDWLEEVTRTGLSHNHYLSYAGTPWKEGAYRISAGCRNVQGLGAKYDGFEQLTSRLQFEQSLFNEALKLKTNLGYFDNTGDVLPADVIRYALTFNPAAPTRISESGFNIPESLRQRAISNYDDFFEEEAFGYHNPVAIQELFRQQQRENALLSQVSARYTPFAGLIVDAAYHRMATEYGFDQLAQRTSRYIGGASGPEADRGFVSQDTRSRIHQQFDLTTHINLLQKKKRSLGLALGYFHQRFDRQETFRRGRGFPQENVRLNDVPELLQLVSTSRFYQRDSLDALEKITAFHGTLRYRHKRLVDVHGRLRYEGSSRNGPSARFGWYGTLGASLNLSDLLLVGPPESFYFRASYEVAGQQPFGVADYRSRRQSVFIFNQAPQSGGFTRIEQFVNAPNPDLAPERVKTINFGLDYVPWDSAPFQAKVDFYLSSTTDLLVPDLPRYRSSAFVLPPVVANVSDLALRSSGVELSLSYLLGLEEYNRYNKFTLQVATYSAQVQSIEANGGYRWGTQEQRLFSGSTSGVGGCCGSLSYLAPGQEVGYFQAAVMDVAASQSAGNLILEDDGAPAIVGGGLPNLSLNVINEFRRDCFSLNVVFSGVFGHEIANFRNGLLGNEANLIGRPIDNLLISDQTLRGVRTQSISNTDYVIESGNYLTLSNLRASFQLRQAKAGKKAAAEVYLAGQNLLLMSNYSGTDPSVRFFNDTNQNGMVEPGERQPVPGIDPTNSLLRAATITFGLQLVL